MREYRRPFKSRGVAVALAIFLGGLGIHKFYLDKPGIGILYLLFCWTFIPAFISFIDALCLCFMSDWAFQCKYNGMLEADDCILLTERA